MWVLITIPLLSLSLVCGVSYALCLLLSLMQCCLNMILWLSWSLGIPLMELSCLVVPCLMQFSLSEDLGFCNPFYLGYFALHPGMTYLVYMHCDILSSIPSLQFGRCTLGWPGWPVISFPLSGVHPSISIVKVTVIAYHCNHLDGLLDSQASALWLTGATIMYLLCDL